MIQPITIIMDKQHYKKCIHCRLWKPKADREFASDAGEPKSEKHAFGSHADNSDGLQVICMACKNIMGTRARNKNPVQRIRHHTGTRCLTQLGDLAPDNFVANLESHLGYRINRLVKHLGTDLKVREGKTRKLNDALNEGYHIDHKIPLSSFNVVRKDQHQIDVVDWDAFRRCWAMDNLQAIPADENLAKGAKVDVESTEERPQAQAQTEEGDHTDVSAQTEEEGKDAEEEGKVTIAIDGPLSSPSK